MDIFQHVGHFFAAAGLLVSSFLGHHNGVTTNVSSTSDKPAITSQNSTSDDSYNSTKSITYEGHTIIMTVSVPKNGGAITGNVSGLCSGKINGQYDGKDNGVMNGKADFTCQLLFVQIPGSATFNGTFDKTDKTAQLQATVNVDSFQKSTPVTFSFN